MKQLVIADDSLQKLREIKDIKELIDFIVPYYPELDIRTYEITKIEAELNNIFIKIIGKIMQYSPENMRRFLKSYLLKYEILNIKQIILGSIIGMSTEEKSSNTSFIVEEYLGNKDFIRDLLEIRSLNEIQFYMRGTKYNEAVREGLLYYKNNNEIFVLEAFLDQLYYKQLLIREKRFNKKEKKLINTFVDSLIEIYNLNLIYRGIQNKIDTQLLSQFLIDHYLLLDKTIIDDLMYINNTNDFYTKLNEHFKNIEHIKDLYKKYEIRYDHLIWSLEALYLNYYLQISNVKIEDIEGNTIHRIIEVILRKEKEIRFDIIPSVIKIIHKKFDILRE